MPEPELVLVFNRYGDRVGFTIGNDMSSRDIEGENLLYLPQAKTYRASCAIGPWIRLGVDEAEARSWGIRMEIHRADTLVFQGRPRFPKSSARSMNWPAGCTAVKVSPTAACC